MRPFARCAVGLLLVTGCMPALEDYWASLRDQGPDGSPDADADTDADSDTDTDTDECGEDAGTCGDAGPDTDTSTYAWDGSVDAGDFCGNPAYEIFLSQTGFAFDNSEAPFRGNAVSPEVVITGFSYFGCPHCETAAGILESLFSQPAYADRAVYYFRHFPFGTSDQASWTAHRAARAAQIQGEFWGMHDAIFAAATYPSEDELFQMAEDLGLDCDEFALDYASDDVAAFVSADKDEGLAAGVSGTPSIFVNGIKVSPWMILQDVLDCLLGYTTWVPPDSGEDI